MKFLYPEFLLALFFLSVPILIHLFNFRKFKKAAFTNVKFLREIKQETTSRSKLRHLLVLAARLLTIFFLVMAFAQPFLPGNNAVPVQAAQMVSIYVDNSYSMETFGRQGTLFEEARRKAGEIAGAYSSADKFQLLTNDFEGRHQRILSRDEFLSALKELTISPAYRSIDEVILRQKDLFLSLHGTAKTIYLVSDFQKNILAMDRIKEDPLITIRAVPVKASSLSNLAIDTVYFNSPLHRTGQKEELIVRIRNSGETTVASTLRLLIGGEQKSIAELLLEGGESKFDTLRYTLSGSGPQEGELQLRDNPITFDDTYYFSYQVSKEMRLLCINGNESNPYIQAVYLADPYFRLMEMDAGQINYRSFREVSFIILNEIPEISSGLAQELRKFLEKGGHILVIPPFQASIPNYASFLSTVRADRLEAIKVFENKVDYINLQHPVFQDVFEQIPANLDLPAVRQYYALSTDTRSNRDQLLKMSGGDIFLARYPYKKGITYVMPFPLNLENTNLPKHAIFVPLMFKMALLSMEDQPVAYTIGQNNIIRNQEILPASQNNYRLRKNNLEFIPDVQLLEEGRAGLYVSDQVREAGNYRFSEGSRDIASFSFNYNRKESDIRYYSSGDLEDILETKGIQFIDPGKRSLGNVINEANYGTRLWKVCIILALIFLAAEILLLVSGAKKPVNTSIA